MNIRTKLALAMIALVAIPILFINLYSTGKVKDNNRKMSETQISHTLNIQKENLNNYFKEILNTSKEISSLNEVKSLLLRVNNKENPDSKGYKSDFEHVSLILQTNSKIESKINSCYILDNSGQIIVSSNPQKNATKAENFEDIKKYSTMFNGISPIKALKENEKNFYVFYAVKPVFSENNKQQGFFVQVIDTDFIQKIMNDSKIYSSTNTFIIDNNMNLFDAPFNDIRSYSSYMPINKALSYVSNALDGNKKEEPSFYEGVVNDKPSLLYYKIIDNCRWAIFSYTKMSDINSFCSSQVSGINRICIVFFLVLTILAVLFIYTFTKPIISMVDILTKKRRGDQAVRFNITTADEIGKIGSALNTMLDDVFESEQRYRTIVEMTDNIIFEINFKRNTVFVSNNFNQKFSFRAKTDSVQDSFFIKGRIHKDDKERFSKDFDKIIGSSNYLQGEYRWKNIYGDFAWFMIRATKFFDRESIPSKVIGVMVDIDREKKSEMHLIQRANFDALTQVYNRETFIKSLNYEFEASNKNNSLNAVLFIDLDDFKHFNDEYNHTCGDEVLKYTAECLKEIVYDKGFVGRFGGDEFVVCLKNIQYFADPGKICSEIIDALKKGFVSESSNVKLAINCSIGIAFFHENGSNVEEVLNAADEAMYSIKKHGKSNYAYASGNENVTV